MASESKVIDRDLGWRAILETVKAAKGDAYAKVGVLADTEKGGMHEVGPDGKPSPLTVAEVAAVLEFGTEDGHIPERSAVRSTFDEEKEELQKRSYELMADILFGKITRDDALNILGAQLVAAIKKKITTGAGVPPPNAPSTVMQKASIGRTAKYFAGAGGRARNLGEAFAQIGAAAAVRTWIDTGRLLAAFTWAIVRGKE